MDKEAINRRLCIRLRILSFECTDDRYIMESTSYFLWLEGQVRSSLRKLSVDGLVRIRW